MANLSSHKTDAERFRSVDIFVNRPATCGLWRASSNNMGISFSMNGSDDPKYDPDGNNNDIRSYSLQLHYEDTKRVVNLLMDNNFLVSDLWNKTPERHIVTPILEECGIYFDTYRCPVEKQMSQDGFFYVRAVNHRHAVHKLRKIMRTLDPATVELYVPPVVESKSLSELFDEEEEAKRRDDIPCGGCGAWSDEPHRDNCSLRKEE